MDHVSHLARLAIPSRECQAQLPLQRQHSSPRPALAGCYSSVPGGLARAVRAFLNEIPAVAHERLTVHLDRATFAKIADQIPVNGRLVGASRLRISRAERHVHSAADLLVEENILGEGCD